MDSSCSQQNKHGIMVEGHGLDSVSSSDVSDSSISTTLSDFMDDDATSTTESSSASSSSSSSDQVFSGGPLYKMSSLLQQLPIKRGLSKYFQGKSQSFTSLSNVRSLEDLAKSENPYNKKIKYCKSYGGLLESHKSLAPNTSSKIISKKPSRGSCYAANVRKNNSFLGNGRPPVPSPRSNTFLIA